MFSPKSLEIYYLEQRKKFKIGSIWDKNELLIKRYIFKGKVDCCYYKGEKVFDVTNNKPYSITITQCRHNRSQLSLGEMIGYVEHYNNLELAIKQTDCLKSVMATLASLEKLL